VFGHKKWISKCRVVIGNSKRKYYGKQVISGTNDFYVNDRDQNKLTEGPRVAPGHMEIVQSLLAIGLYMCIRANQSINQSINQYPFIMAWQNAGRQIEELDHDYV